MMLRSTVLRSTRGPLTLRPSSLPSSSPKALQPSAPAHPLVRTAQITRVAPEETSSAASTSAPLSTPATVEGVNYTTHSWMWNGYKCKYATAGCGEPIVMVHGFGASIGHYRKTIKALADAGYKVYALDLLAFGASAKPKDYQYTIEGWRDQVCDFISEFVGTSKPVVLVGNSIGSLIALAANAKLTEERPGSVRGTILLNCAGAMNNKILYEKDPPQAISDDWRIKLLMPVFLFIDFLLKTPPIAKRLFEAYRGPENIRNILNAVYMNKEAVTNELVDIFYGPSNDDGALESFVAILTGPPGPRPESLIPLTSGPLLVLWGDKDPFTPANGPVGKYFQQLPSQRSATRFAWIEDVGHAPHDDRPERVYAEMLPWLEEVVAVPAAAPAQ